MTEEEINYRTLRKIQQLEKNSPVLSNIPSNFYSSMVDYLKEINERLQKEESSQKKTLLKDEVENTKKLSLSIYELREKKILLAAVSKARGGNPDIKNLIESEKKLFDSILQTMLSSRSNIFEKEEVSNEESTEEETPKESKKQIKDEKIETKNLNPIVKVEKDMPEFIGTDEKKYFLRKNDLLSLPPDMSKMLVERGVVETLNHLA